ncbi:MAG TPA: hypothetical protein VE172_12025 [Stackebrandtia sp.]|jgi:nitroreductase|uniref:hypothetical protein n=1 Tax=Stackebrandtia sp. TaxID=2023065 RepID=UPI002D531A96|nr:hypothetical protein [Stackebrandtia sp.]HZE39527.1 hypothetical protein [Stackebrandtia sp.]
MTDIVKIEMRAVLEELDAIRRLADSVKKGYGEAAQVIGAYSDGSARDDARDAVGEFDAASRATQDCDVAVQRAATAIQNFRNRI